MRAQGKKVQPAPAPAERKFSSRGEGEAAETKKDAAELDLLRRQYRSLTGKSVHSSVPRFLLARAVAYELQVREHGDLSAQIVSALAAVAKGELGPPGGTVAGSEGAVALVGAPTIRSGTVLVREHQNVLHRVTALETGFIWNGRTFASLSAVARAITGVRWNGPRFFGLGAKTGGRLARRGQEGEKAPS